MVLPIYIDFTKDHAEYALNDLKETVSDIELILEKSTYSHPFNIEPTGIVITPARNQDTKESRALKDKHYTLQYINNIVERHIEPDKFYKNITNVIPMKYDTLETQRITIKHDDSESK